MSNTQTTSHTDLPQNLLNESGKSRYKMGEWEDMEEDYALLGMKRALKRLQEEGKVPPHQGV